ncbi:hypothetical protein M9H77_32660 [Catharanthus roseus]|uniref:Uncharacterized protein n=1 Tax=Catharanthus roseus TaxID=4058 RepID=A0ACC0A622_CATRO|nr:hypothetical protein M9H77_32660 [Catharanthus roseus]
MVGNRTQASFVLRTMRSNYYGRATSQPNPTRSPKRSLKKFNKKSISGAFFTKPKRFRTRPADANHRRPESEPDTEKEHIDQRNFDYAKDEEQTEEETTARDREPVAINGNDIQKAIEVIERDSLAIAQSYNSLFASLRSALSQVTGTSIDHMSCFGDAAGRLQECALDATTKGNRLNEEMKRVPDLAIKLICSMQFIPVVFISLMHYRKELRRAVDALDSAVNTTVRLP